MAKRRQAGPGTREERRAGSPASRPSSTPAPAPAVDAITEPTGPPDLFQTQPDAVGDLESTEETALPGAASGEASPESPRFFDAPTASGAAPPPARSAAFHEASTEQQGRPGPRFFELPTEHLGRIHEEITDVQVAAPEHVVAAPKTWPTTSPEHGAAAQPRITVAVPPPRSRGRSALLGVAVASTLLLAALATFVALRDTRRRLEVGAPLQHGEWRLVLLGAEEGLNTAGKPALRISLRLLRPGHVVRPGDVQLLLLDGHGKEHAPYELRRVAAETADVDRSPRWQASYRLLSSPPYPLRFAPPGEPLLDFEFVTAPRR